MANPAGIIWKRELPHRGASEIFMPRVFKDRIYINTDGYTTALDKNGNILFTAENSACNHIQPAVNDSTGEESIYVITRSGLTSLNSRGKTRWSVKTGTISHTPIINGDGIIYLAEHDGNALAVDPLGNILWKKRIRNLESREPLIDKNGYIHYRLFEGSLAILQRQKGLFKTSPQMDVKGKPNRSVFSSVEGFIYAPMPGCGESKYICMDTDGNRKWEMDLPGETKNLHIKTGCLAPVLFIIRTDTIMKQAMETDQRNLVNKKRTVIMGFAQEGNRLFTFKSPDREKLSKHIVPGNGILFLSTQDAPGRIYCVDTDGRLIWQNELPHPIHAPLLVKDLLVAGGKDNPVTAFKVETGEKVFSADMNLASGHSMAVGDDNLIIAVDKNSAIYGITTDI